MFSKAIVRRPAISMADGITTANLGVPDYQKARQQHQAYIDALERCGLDVTVLEAEERFPDSVFVEDTALLTPACAILTRPGALPRQGEVACMADCVRAFFKTVEQVQPPGCVEAGDIMMVASHFYIGLSERTNAEGADQMIRLLERCGMTGSTVEMREFLHLKTGLSYLENNHLLVCGEFVGRQEFSGFDQIMIDDSESYAANSVWINGNVLVPAGYPNAAEDIRRAGYQTIELEMSEFQKLDGGLSCLSLRF